MSITINPTDEIINICEFKSVDSDPEEIVRFWQDDAGIFRIAVRGEECVNRVALREAFLSFAASYEFHKNTYGGVA